MMQIHLLIVSLYCFLSLFHIQILFFLDVDGDKNVTFINSKVINFIIFHNEDTL